MRVTAEKEGFAGTSRKYTSHAGAISTGTIVLNESVSGTMATVTGTISYEGSKGGRIYVRLASRNQYGGPNKYYGTSIDAPGGFTIRGVPAGQYAVQAFMDVQGNMVRHLTDPSAEYPNTFEGMPPLDISVGSYAIAEPITLQDPDPMSLPAELLPPEWVDVTVSKGAALISWEMASEESTRNGGGPGAAFHDSYDVQAVANDNTETWIRDIPSAPERENPVVMTGLDETKTYRFYVYAKLGGNTSGPSLPAPSDTGVRPVDQAGGVSISGTVDLNGHTPQQGAKLYVAAVNENDEAPARFTVISAPAASQSYIVKGVPAGKYRIFAVLDQNSDGVFNAGDIIVHEKDAPAVTVSTASLTGKNVSLPTSEAEARVITVHWYHQSFKQEGYAVRAEVDLPLSPVRSVTLTAAPGFQGVQDAGFNDWGAIELRWDSAMPPRIGDNYQLRVTFADGRVENHSLAVTGITGLPTGLAPNGEQQSFNSTPIFTWKAPSTIPAGATYDWWMNEENGMGGRHYEEDDLLSSTTSMSFSTFTAQGEPPLDPDSSYYWGISIEDALGNRGETMALFCGPGVGCSAPVGEPPVVIDFTPKYGT
ncbi:hypothetical protein EG829_16595, partial [bacterium]|nr:hypothetical protein [bacterium]